MATRNVAPIGERLYPPGTTFECPHCGQKTRLCIPARTPRCYAHLHKPAAHPAPKAYYMRKAG